MQTIHLTIQATPEVAKLLIPILQHAAKAAPQDVNEYLTLKQAAEECPYSLASLRRWIVHERAVDFSQPAGKGGTVSVKRSELQRLLKMKQKQGVSPRAKVGRPRKEPELYV